MKKGVSLLEVIVASIILGISVVGCMMLYMEYLKFLKSQEEYYCAENSLRQCMEELNNKPGNLDDQSKWVKVGNNPQVRNQKPIKFKLPSGEEREYEVFIDTGTVYAINGTTSSAMKRKFLNAKVTFDRNDGKKNLEMFTVVNYDYGKPPVND